MAFSAKQFSVLMSGVQSLMVAVGVIVAGFWTFMTFGGVTDQAGPILDITLSASSIADSAQPGESYLHVIATVVNRGKSRADLDFSSQPPLTIAHVRTNANGNVGYSVVREVGIAAAEPRQDKKAIIELSKVTLLPAVTKEYSFLLPSLPPGIYFVTFNARRASDTSTLWTGGVFVDLKGK